MRGNITGETHSYDMLQREYKFEAQRRRELEQENTQLRATIVALNRKLIEAAFPEATKRSETTADVSPTGA